MGCEYLYVCGSDGILKVFNRKSQRLIKNYGKVACTSMVFTNDRQYLFIGDSLGYLTQYSTQQQKPIKKYGKLLENRCASMLITNDNKYLYLGGWNGSLIKIDIE